MSNVELEPKTDSCGRQSTTLVFLTMCMFSCGLRTLSCKQLLHVVMKFHQILRCQIFLSPSTLGIAFVITRAQQLRKGISLVTNNRFRITRLVHTGFLWRGRVTCEQRDVLRFTVQNLNTNLSK